MSGRASWQLYIRAADLPRRVQPKSTPGAHVIRAASQVALRAVYSAPHEQSTGTRSHCCTYATSMPSHLEPHQHSFRHSGRSRALNGVIYPLKRSCESSKRTIRKLVYPCQSDARTPLQVVTRETVVGCRKGRICDVSEQHKRQFLARAEPRRPEY